MYIVDFDPAARVLHVSATGFWSLTALAGFSTTILAKCIAIKLRHGDFATLIDLRDFPVQSNDVAHGIEVLLAQAVKITTAPVATVTGGRLLKMQAERVLKGDHIRVFLNIDEARRWLAECWPVPTRAAA